MAAKNKSDELKLTRVYDAPVKAVWDAWTDVKQVAQWWGPRGFTLTTHSRDLRPGGTWHYTMHGPDGTNYVNKTLYHEVEKHSRLVYDHGGNDEREPLFRVTVTFKETAGKTQMEMTMKVFSPEALNETLAHIKKARGHSTWDRLAEYLAKQVHSDEVFVINHSFEASVETMFQMWTDPKHLGRWMSPVGTRMEFVHADIRPGGSFECLISGPDLKLRVRADYLEIHRPDRIVYTQHFLDEKGSISRHPGAPTSPAKFLTMVTLSEEGPNQTRVTVRWAPHGQFTREEVETFLKMRDDMTEGWTGSFEKLEEILRGG